MNNDEFLKNHCNRYMNGQCMTTSCLLRGGWKRGELPVDYNKATCQPHEILVELQTLRNQQQPMTEQVEPVKPQVQVEGWCTLHPMTGNGVKVVTKESYDELLGEYQKLAREKARNAICGLVAKEIPANQQPEQSYLELCGISALIDGSGVPEGKGIGWSNAFKAVKKLLERIQELSFEGRIEEDPILLEKVHMQVPHGAAIIAVNEGRNAVIAAAAMLLRKETTISEAFAILWNLANRKLRDLEKYRTASPMPEEVVQLWYCNHQSGTDVRIADGVYTAMKPEMDRRTARGSDVWLILPDGTKELPDGTRVSVEQQKKEAGK